MELDKAISERRSYRSLKKVNIDDSIIYKLGKAASMAPSCYNNQPWRFVFVNDEKTLTKTFSALSEGNKWAKDSSMLIAVCAAKDDDCTLDDGRFYHHFDTGMATAFLLLKAAELSLAAHVMAGYDAGKMKKILNVPDKKEVLALIGVGEKSDEIKAYFKDFQIEAEKNRPARLDLDKFVFKNKFKKV